MVTVEAYQDSYAISDADSPHGSESVLAVIDNATHIAHTYLKFDLSAWAGKTLDEDSGGLLKLHISSNEIPSGGNTVLRFRRIISDWDEATLKWSNVPSITTHHGKTKSIHSNDSGWETYNITELIQDIIDSGNYYGVYVEIGDYVVWFDSTESSYEPKLSLTEAVPIGDITSGDVQPTSQDAYENVDVAVDIKNVGLAGGNFSLYYYEGATFLRAESAGWLNPGQSVSDVVEIFQMPDRDFTVTIKIYNARTEAFDDTYSVTCYLISATDYYVKAEGNDSLSGTSWAAAWATIDKAATTIPDGSAVHIGFGTYNAEPPGNTIAPQNTGSQGISYKPETVGSTGGTGIVTIERNA